MKERESMPDSFESTEDLQEPSQPVCPALPVQPPDVQAPPDSVPVAALTGDQENLSILNGHQNFFVPALSDADHQVMILHVSNGTFQQTEQDGVVKSDGDEDSPTNTQTWQVFSHEIRVKTGLPGTETWSQENGHNGKLSFDTLELEEATLSQENGHNGKLSFDTLELEEATLKRSVEEGQALVQTATDEQFEVIRYAEWLTAEAKRNIDGSHQEESDKYAEDALKTVTLKGQEFRPFAPFRQALSASKTLTRGQVVILSTLMLGCVLSLLFYGMKLVIVIIALITLLYLSSLLLDFLLAMLALNQSTEEQIEDAIVHALADANWPQYTILCPLYREVEVVPQFVQAMQALDYPADKLQIRFLTEEDDVETRKAIAAMHLPQHFSIVTVPAGQPRTKPRACNFGLLQATGDYVVIYDAEDVPDPLQLKKAVLTFANHDSDVACVQAKLNYYNGNQNLLTRWFTVEYCLWFDLMLPGMQQTKLPLPLGGTSNHFRMEMLHRVGAWDPLNITEDCDLGLRLARSGLKTIVLNSITYEEANSQLKNWIRQRSRWIKGYLLTYLVYMREPLRYLRPGRLREFLSLQLVIGGKTAVLFVNPLMWVLLAIYILFRPVDVYHTLFPGPILYMGTLCLIFGNFFYTYIHLIGCMKLSRFSLIKWALSIPIYWAMMTVAASLALYQLIFKPHYWEKTKHGLHLRSSHSSSGRTTVEEEPQSGVTMQLPAFTSTKHASPPLPAPHSSSASTTVEEEPKSVATMQSPAFTSTKGVPPLLPAPRASSGSTAEEEDL